MPDRSAIDRENRIHALAFAVEAHHTGTPASSILATATKFLGWLRQPAKPAAIRLIVGPPIEK